MDHEIAFLKYHKDWVNFVSLGMLDFGHKSGFICWFLGQWVKSGYDGFNYYYHYFPVKGCYYSKVTGAERINSLLLICVSYIWTQSFHSFSPVWTQIAFSRRAQICCLTWQLLFFLPFSKLCLLCSCFFFFPCFSALWHQRCVCFTDRRVDHCQEFIILFCQYLSSISNSSNNLLDFYICTE